MIMITVNLVAGYLDLNLVLLFAVVVVSTRSSSYYLKALHCPRPTSDSGGIMENVLDYLDRSQYTQSRQNVRAQYL